MGPVQRVFHRLPSHSQVCAREPEAQPTTGSQAKPRVKRQVPATGATSSCDCRYCQTPGPALAPKGARRNTSLPVTRTCLPRRTTFSRNPWALYAGQSFFSLLVLVLWSAHRRGLCFPERLPPVLAPRICFPSCFVAHSFQIYRNPTAAPSNGKLLGPEGFWEW